MLKIGIPSCFQYPDLDRLVFGAKTLCYIEKDMARYMVRPDVMPILIPDLAAADLKRFLDELDGFVFMGGTDLAPETYQEQPIGRWKGDPVRDEFELGIMDYAMKGEKPILGICRGHQLMNAYFGGTLYQDIQTQRPEALKHRDAQIYDQLNHEIHFTKGKLLERIHAGEKSNKVNTIHHQAIKDLGKDLEVLAISPEDGIIEAIQWKKAPEGKVMSVQWHPEFHYNSKEKLINPGLIYEVFLSNCGRKV